MITLQQPLGLAALLVIPVIWACIRLADRRRRSADAALGGGLAMRPPFGARRAHLRNGLLLGALFTLGIGVARPAWGSAEQPLERRGVDIAVALDVSRSMAAADVPPSRAQAAAEGLQRLLRALPGDRVSLVTFAGTAFQRSPLTLDLDAVSQLIEQAQGETALVDRGTDLALAIEAALITLAVEDAADTQVVVLVSDGEHVGRDLDGAIRRATEAGVRVYTVAAGTSEGASIPGSAPAGGAESRLDRGTLERIAAATGGRTRELGAVAGLAVDFSRLRQSTFEGTTQSAPIERFPLFLAAGLAMLLLRSLVDPWGHRRTQSSTRELRKVTSGVAAVIAIMLGGCSGTAAWQAVEDGNRAFDRGRYEQALAAYDRASTLAPDDPAVTYNRGNTLHRLSRLEEASVVSLAAATAATDHPLREWARYALGNHAFLRDDLAAAREAYVAVLRANPGDEDARHNLELVLQRQREREEAEQARQQSGNNGNPQNQGGDPAPGSNGSGSPSGSGTPSPAGQRPPGTAGRPGEGVAPPATPLTEEEAQAALTQALAGLGAEVSAEQARAVLDRLRELNALERLEDRRAPGSMPDR